MGREDILLSTLSSFSEFYGNKCMSNAAFLLAVVFGLFSMLQITASLWILIPYVLTVLGGLYFSLNYKYYNDYTSWIQHCMIDFDRTQRTVQVGTPEADKIYIRAYLDYLVYPRWNTRLRRFFLKTKTTRSNEDIRNILKLLVAMEESKGESEEKFAWEEFEKEREKDSKKGWKRFYFLMLVYFVITVFALINRFMT